MYPSYWDEDKDDRDGVKTVEREADFGKAKNAYQVNVANNKKVQVILVKNFTKNRSFRRSEHLKKRREQRRPRKVRRTMTSDEVEEPQVSIEEPSTSSSQDLEDPWPYPLVKLECLQDQVNDVLSD